MTVIAYDGRTLAADKQCTSNGAMALTTKIHRLRGHLVGGSGDAAVIREHMVWFASGADPAKFPEHLRDGGLPSWLLAITPEGRILSYENAPYPVEIESSVYAIGSGRDFAMAAMHLGKTADEAVEVACALSNSCGGGVDTLELGDS